MGDKCSFAYKYPPNYINTSFIENYNHCMTLNPRGEDIIYILENPLHNITISAKPFLQTSTF